MTQMKCYVGPEKAKLLTRTVAIPTQPSSIVLLHVVYDRDILNGCQ